ncbi:ferritin-like fold-containing protein [Demetria terragena]|uniref:ferritin-like fold-containing protein n=1 Tax=Demetria terragena TaxID=63959 RepID=UPI0003607FD9|nr:ferritin-like fold-containing protein [Demetria terragena]
MSDTPARDLTDPDFRKGVLDVLGALAYGELVGFFAIVRDAEGAPEIGLRMRLAEVAVAEHSEYERLTGRISELGGDPEAVMEPFAESFDAWHQRTQPGSWHEGLMKVYTGNSLAADFYREIARYVDPETQQLVADVLGRGRHVEFAAGRLREAITQDQKIAGRLALFGRRMVGEALTQAQQVAADRDAMTALLMGGGPGGGGADLAELARMFARITQRHTERMEALGLSA